MWRLYPAHSQIPVTSQHDLSILMAVELIKALGAVVLTMTTETEKIKHIKAIQDSTAILAGRQTTEGPTVRTGTSAPRVAAQSPRVANVPPPRVATTLNNITAPNVIRNMLLVHEHHTRHNNPFNILTHDDDDDDTVVASNCSPRIPPPFLPTSDLPVRQPTNRPTRRLAIQPKSLPEQSTHLSTTEGAGKPNARPSHYTHNTSSSHPCHTSHANKEAHQNASTHQAAIQITSHC